MVDGGAGMDAVALSIDRVLLLPGRKDWPDFTNYFKNFEQLDIVGDISVGTGSKSITVSEFKVDAVGLLGRATGSVSDQFVLEDMPNGGTLVFYDKSYPASTVFGSVQVGIAEVEAVESLTIRFAERGWENADFNAGRVELKNVQRVTLDVESVDASQTGIIALQGDALESVSVTSDQGGLNLSTVSPLLTQVDASQMSGSLEYVARGSVAGTKVTGGRGDDRIEANGNNDILEGGAGDDALFAFGQDTRADGGPGNDRLVGATRSILTGGPGTDQFAVTGRDTIADMVTIMDLQSSDTIDLFDNKPGFRRAKVEVDSLSIRDHADAAIAALEADGNGAGWFQLLGDTYVVWSGHDTVGGSFIEGVDGIVRLLGELDLSTATLDEVLQPGASLSGPGSQPITGTPGDDTIGTGSGNDVLFGEAGDDTLDGGAGNDIIRGGLGADSMTGGTGSDTFTVFFGESGITETTADTITDFSTGEDSLRIGVELEGFNAVDGGKYNDFAAFKAAADSAIGDGGGDVEAFFAWNVADSGDGWLAIDIDGDDGVDAVIKLEGLSTEATLAQGDFMV